MPDQAIQPVQPIHQVYPLSQLPTSQLTATTQQFPATQPAPVEKTQAETTQQVVQAPQPEVLFEGQTLFPFDLVPTRVKLTSMSLVVIEDYILSKQTTTFMIVDILDVELKTFILSSTLTIIRKQTPLPPYQIKFLRKADAEKLKNLLHGLIILNSEKADVAHADPQLVKDKAAAIGESTT